MTDVRKKAKDLLRLALEGSTEGERAAATVPLLKLIEKYDLLSAGGKPVNVAADMLKDFLERISSMDMDGLADHAEKVASGAEKFASSVERGMAALNRITGVREREPRRRRRIR
jgi:hypothetical protein